MKKEAWKIKDIVGIAEDEYTAEEIETNYKEQGYKTKRIKSTEGWYIILAKEKEGGKRMIEIKGFKYSTSGNSKKVKIELYTHQLEDLITLTDKIQRNFFEKARKNEKNGKPHETDDLEADTWLYIRNKLAEGAKK